MLGVFVYKMKFTKFTKKSINVVICKALQQATQNEPTNTPSRRYLPERFYFEMPVGGQSSPTGISW